MFPLHSEAAVEEAAADDTVVLLLMLLQGMCVVDLSHETVCVCVLLCVSVPFENVCEHFALVQPVRKYVCAWVCVQFALSVHTAHEVPACTAARLTLITLITLNQNKHMPTCSLYVRVVHLLCICASLGAAGAEHNCAAVGGLVDSAAANQGTEP